ncbi:beta-lactamase family protein [Parahaliea maris]|uniref:Beta-lactamase family protein n=1 Tax=Parahaliea maris TaxID=2716870 RepID=A0A5C8ZSX7_9GAMM|nr:serine hydrolase domain-containing protein [Parahaliea maris]TXS90780.1 beta-lactamase family protein [Parahaliea maris]
MTKSWPRFVAILLAVWMTASSTLGADSEARPVENSTEVPPALAAAINTLLQEHHVPGASVAVMDGYRILWAQGFGVASLTGAQPVTVHTRFQACSLSKPVAVRALLTLVDAGKVELDQPANRYLKRWQIPNNSTFKGDIITVRQLVTHSAGLSASFYPGYRPGEKLPDTLTDMLNGEPPTTSEPVEPIFEAGSQWRYSGGGLLVVQLLIEDVTGQAFAAFMQSTVLNPLQMADSTYVSPYPEALLAVSAVGYAQDGTLVPGGYREYPAAAVAGLWTTASDLARSMIALQKNVNGLEPGFVSRTLARDMLTPQETGLPPQIEKIPTFTPQMGLGYLLEGRDPNTGKPTRFWHWGDNPGYKALQVATLEGGRGVVILTNSDAGVAVTRPIAERVADYYGWPLEE